MINIASFGSIVWCPKTITNFGPMPFVTVKSLININTNTDTNNYINVRSKADK